MELHPLRSWKSIARLRLHLCHRSDFNTQSATVLVTLHTPESRCRRRRRRHRTELRHGQHLGGFLLTKFLLQLLLLDLSQLRMMRTVRASFTQPNAMEFRFQVREPN